MSPLQVAGLIFVAAFPLICWWCGRHRLALAAAPPSLRWPERFLAGGLIVAYLGDVLYKVQDGHFHAANALPMQLCDWALVAIVIALWSRSTLAFDLAYFWGLSGTLQALFTPAIASDVPWLRQAGFFFIHAGIVAGVLHLLLNEGFRPRARRSLLRIVVASEIYLLTALSVNHLTGGNYGFLSQKPVQHSMLDLFSNQPWRYALELNLTAFLFFALLYLPWFVIDHRRRTISRVPR